MGERRLCGARLKAHAGPAGAVGGGGGAEPGDCADGGAGGQAGQRHGDSVGVGEEEEDGRPTRGDGVLGTSRERKLCVELFCCLCSVDAAAESWDGIHPLKMAIF